MGISDISKGTVIKDNRNDERYLVISIDNNKNVIRCINDKFNIVNINTDYLKEYSVYSTIDIKSFIKEVSKDTLDNIKCTLLFETNHESFNTRLNDSNNDQTFYKICFYDDIINIIDNTFNDKDK